MESEPSKERGQRHSITLAEVAVRPTCSIDEAASLLGIGRSTAFAAARDGSLPTVRLSHRLLVPTAKLMAMLGVEREREE